MRGDSIGPSEGLGPRLEELYARYNRRAYVSPDPLQFLYGYEDAADREVVGLVASSLAFGHVKQILRSVSSALERLPEPALNIRGAGRSELRAAFRGFQHRYVTGEDLADMLYGAGRLTERCGSLGACFRGLLQSEEETTLGALARFVEAFREETGRRSYLMPSPSDGSACKRLHLYLRWMVRQDDVDPGGWGVPASKLVVPLDTHMHRIALALGLTGRRTADGRAALEVTEAFRRVSPDDPVRYDFSLTRLGIRSDTDLEGFLRGCGRSGRARTLSMPTAARAARARADR